MEPVIQIKNLVKSYSGKQVLKGINLAIYPGQVIGYIGPNGAGKSTTVKILCGLIDDFGGEVQIAGMNMKTDALKIKSRIGYVPELAELYEVLTPFEFLGFMATLYSLPLSLAEDRISRMLSAFGLEANQHQRMDTFSKGMRQKVLIISGILHNPDILFLDEPLSGLDANSVIIVKELISKLSREGKTIFYCSHMMDVVERVSDRIVLINEGEVLTDCTMEELKASRDNQSLENIFAQMTSQNTLSHAADDLINAFRK